MTVYATCAVICGVAAVLVSFIHLINDKQDKRPITLESVFAGFSYIWNRRVLLGVMSLDLFVVRKAEPFGEGWWQPLVELAGAGLPTLYRRACELAVANCEAVSAAA